MQRDSQKGSLGNLFDQLDVAPSAGLWDAIASNLGDKKKRRGAFWWWMGSGLAACFLLAFLVYRFSSDYALVSTTAAANEVKFSTSNTLKEPLIDRFKSLKEDEFVADVTEQNISDVSFVNVSQNNKNTEEVPDDVPANKFGEKRGLTNDLTGLDPILQVEPNRFSSREPVDRMRLKPAGAIVGETHSTDIVAIDVQHKVARNWEVGLVATSFSSMASSLKSSYEINFTDSNGISAEQQDFSSLVRKSQKPIGLGFHLGYQLNSRARIVTGVNAELTVYRYQNSAAMADANELFFNEPNKNAIRIYSLGIPLGFEFDFLKTGRFRAGIGFNLLNEIPIVQSYLPNYDLNFVGKQTQVRTFISGYHFGLNPNLNLSYFLSEKLKIQFNPGMRWYAHQSTKSSIDLPQRKMWFGSTLRMVWDI